MNHYGKLLGGALGWVLMRHPIGAVLGIALGHVLDAGWLRGSDAQADHDAAYRELGVEPDASDEDVERAYRRLISEYHPDKVAGAAKEIRELAETRARAINTAYESIQKLRRYRR